jgi:hypothetical protein
VAGESEALSAADAMNVGVHHPLEQRWARQVGSRFELAWSLANAHAVATPPEVGWAVAPTLGGVWAAGGEAKADARAAFFGDISHGR